MQRCLSLACTRYGTRPGLAFLRRSRSRSRSPRAEAGRYGIIYADADYEYKRPEFTLWAREALGKDVDNLTRRDEQALFARFVEAYNTASLPHRKYYDLAEYERRKALKFARLHGIAVVDGRDGGGGSAGEVGGADGAGVSREREVEEERRKEKEEKIRKVKRVLWWVGVVGVRRWSKGEGGGVVRMGVCLGWCQQLWPD